MICVTYLEIDRNLPHLRHLLRRLHQRLPKTEVLVGLWSAPGTDAKDERLRMGVSADHHASSLREAVKACVHAATQGDEPEEKRAPSSRPVLTVVGEGRRSVQAHSRGASQFREPSRGFANLVLANNRDRLDRGGCRAHVPDHHA